MTDSLSKLRVLHAGVYKTAQHIRQKVTSGWIFYHVSGLDHVKLIDLKSGKILFSMDKPGPFLSLFLPEMKLEADFNSRRENWVVGFSFTGIKLDAENSELLFEHHEQIIRLPILQEIPKSQVHHWQMEMHKIREGFTHPNPINRMRADLGIVHVLGKYLESRQEYLEHSPAQDLKRLIDRDDEYEKSLEDLSRECGYSRDHARMLFQKEFSISPGEYRRLKRGADSMELICHTRLSVKEIAHRLGYSHISAFTNSYAKIYGMTPGEAIKKYRQ